LTEEYISDIEEFFQILASAEKYRVVSETFLNKTSSRSHMVDLSHQEGMAVTHSPRQVGGGY
jgi:hypothetical protein